MKTEGWTAPRKEARPRHIGRAPWRPVPALAAVAVLLVLVGPGCGESLESRKKAALEEQRLAGDQDFETRRLTEVERIEILLNRLSTSGLVFIKNGREMSSEAAARMLRRQYERHGDRISTAEQFIGMLGTRGRLTGRAYDIRTQDGTLVPARDWLMAEVALIDPLPSPQAAAASRAQTAAAMNPSPTPSPTSSSGGTDEAASDATPQEPVLAKQATADATDADSNAQSMPSYTEAQPDTIAAAMDRIEQLNVHFVIDAHDKAKRQDLDAKDFVKMLRRKTRWVGADLSLVRGWVDEIASSSLRTLTPYQVVFADGTTVNVGPWLHQRWDLSPEVADDAPQALASAKDGTTP